MKNLSGLDICSVAPYSIVKPDRFGRKDDRRRYLVHDQWMRLRADACTLPNGTVIKPYYVLEENDWVHVFAQNEDGEVLVVRQYRYAAGAICAELPGGVIDEGETPLVAAKRELSEETGYSASEWQQVASVYANPARQTNRVHTFVARGLSKVAEQNLDDTEEIQVAFASVAKIKEMVKEGVFSQSLHIASFYMSLEAIVCENE